jgi:hypothetical protein
LPKRKTKNLHSFTRKENKTSRGVKLKTAKPRKDRNFSFCFFSLAEALRFNFLAHITPSSAAVFKLWFYGTLLRSKTIKPRLKNCPRSAATDAATTC